MLGTNPVDEQTLGHSQECKIYVPEPKFKLGEIVVLLLTGNLVQIINNCGALRFEIAPRYTVRYIVNQHPYMIDVFEFELKER